MKKTMRVDNTLRPLVRPDEDAFCIFASAYPHEAHAKWPTRFWRYFRTQCPGVNRAKMRQILRDTTGPNATNETERRNLADEQ